MAIEGIEKIFAHIRDEHNKIVEANRTAPVSSSKIQEDTEVEKASHPFIADPHISQVKGRPTEKSKGKVNSSGRMLISVEASVPKPRKCSLCEQFGHDKRKCPQKADKEQLKIVEP
ncbi:hypothetical protein MKW92_025576, partial [Papaver armeniacum]